MDKNPSQAKATTTGNEEYIESALTNSLDDKQTGHSPQNTEVLGMGKGRWPRLRSLHQIRSSRVNRQKRGSARSG